MFENGESYEKTMDANQIKLLAILAMTIDHIAWLVFTGYSKAPLALLMHLIGRMTCPIMCFLSPRAIITRGI